MGEWQVGDIARWNQRRFVALTPLVCTNDNLKTVASRSWEMPLDGFLFYHKEAHYVAGLSPLCLWVPADQLASILGPGFQMN